MVVLQQLTTCAHFAKALFHIMRCHRCTGTHTQAVACRPPSTTRCSSITAWTIRDSATAHGCLLHVCQVRQVQLNAVFLYKAARAPSLGHQRQRLEQRKRPAVLLFPALEHVGPTRQCAHIRIFVPVVHECGGKLEAPRRVTVQQLLQPAVTNEQFPAANNAQQRRRVAAATGVTISTRRKHASAAHLLSSG